MSLHVVFEGSRSAHPNRDSECLLLNVAGKLLMFQRDEPGQQIQGKQNKAKPVSILEYCWKILSQKKFSTQISNVLWFLESNMFELC